MLSELSESKKKAMYARIKTLRTEGSNIRQIKRTLKREFNVVLIDELL